MKKATREWVKKADKDFIVAREAAASETPLHDAVCFHCQQCAEKYLKALLVEHSLSVPKTHDLDLLLAAVISQHAELRSLRRGCLFLSVFAVEDALPRS
ncbi:MAG: HEPN domain-containing protein [Gemmataceae bacterium]